MAREGKKIITFVLKPFSAFFVHCGTVGIYEVKPYHNFLLLNIPVTYLPHEISIQENGTNIEAYRHAIQLIGLSGLFGTRSPRRKVLRPMSLKPGLASK